ncbi:MAG TPA: DUF1287 domain-containing protein [Duganella sp.]|nr:DUF1287 domain-containing protein [Duganella sp.]
MRKTLSTLLLALLATTSSAKTASQPETPRASDAPHALVEAARSQVGVTLTYDPAYRRLAYPNGDVPIERGVCTDVVVRAYRKLDVDLQALVHQDMKKAWSAYAHQARWQLKAPDPNIDHRRVPNLATFFARHGATMPASLEMKTYLPGDIVTWRLPHDLTHIGIVSDKFSGDGVPLIIHNIGAGAREENMLFTYPVTGHYRWHPGAADRRR